MSVYVFRAADGSEKELEIPITEAPPVGEEREIEGKVYRRIPSLWTPKVPREVHYRAESLPLDWGKAVTPGGFAPRYDEIGRPCFASEAEVRGAMSKARAHGEVCGWDDEERR